MQGRLLKTKGIDDYSHLLLQKFSHERWNVELSHLFVSSPSLRSHYYLYQACEPKRHNAWLWQYRDSWLSVHISSLYKQLSKLWRKKKKKYKIDIKGFWNLDFSLEFFNHPKERIAIFSKFQFRFNFGQKILFLHNTWILIV